MERVRPEALALFALVSGFIMYLGREIETFDMAEWAIRVVMLSAIAFVFFAFLRRRIPDLRLRDCALLGVLWGTFYTIGLLIALVL